MDNFFESEVYRELRKNRIIFMDGEITDKLASTVVAELLYLDSLSHDDITIYINSSGGSVSAGLMIYDTMKYLKSDVCTIGIGLAASMASIILMAGTPGKRKMLSHSRVMIHEVSLETGGKISDVLINVKESKKTNEELMRIISQNSKFDYNLVLNNSGKDLWLDYEKALKYGIVDKVIN